MSQDKKEIKDKKEEPKDNFSQFQGGFDPTLFSTKESLPTTYASTPNITIKTFFTDNNERIDVEIKKNNKNNKTSFTASCLTNKEFRIFYTKLCSVQPSTSNNYIEKNPTYITLPITFLEDVNKVFESNLKENNTLQK